MQNKILLVEDELAISSSIEQILKAEGFQVECAETLAEATTLFKSRMPDLVLLDYQLPDGPPDKFVEQINTSVPIILITASNNAEAIAQALRIKKVLKKPFDIDALINAIEETLYLS